MPPDFAHTTDDTYNKARLALAHVAEDGRVHPLEEHLNGTAQWTSRLAAELLFDSTRPRSPPSRAIW